MLDKVNAVTCLEGGLYLWGIMEHSWEKGSVGDEMEFLMDNKSYGRYRHSIFPPEIEFPNLHNPKSQ
jgi:hypothetical protein